ncbi:ribonuclease H-like protein [Basidiobolus meristosporus CBS 931.73]|uniref:3'-5' exonuclease n=1 Tax=Basidiobolus meristosporus CBS 931.73 TaxID=1314790 RepID=A0A1Y1YS24_9FUNG|nr:ribonuclease H-like protein [Basidiobolus meristosporus CBS 931.73]|eukprot:ORY00769.1 ribonuclease H-like protein [Basidiobolus meristosporus CBS 931.73]
MVTILTKSFKTCIRVCPVSYRPWRLKFFESKTALLHLGTQNERNALENNAKASGLDITTEATPRSDVGSISVSKEKLHSDPQKPIINVFMSTKAQKLPGLTGTLVYTLKTEQQVREGIQLLRAHIKHQSEKVVGFDTETRTKSDGDFSKVSVIQIATRDICLVIYIQRIVNEGLVFPHSLQLFLQDSDIMKVGVCAHRDSWALKHSYNIKCENVLDLKYMALRLGHRNTTLKSLANKYGNMKLNKHLHFKRWDKRELREKDVVYAAQDAVASYMVYTGMKRLGDTRITSPVDDGSGSETVK